MIHFPTHVLDSQDLLSAYGIARIIDAARTEQPVIDARAFLSNLDASGLALLRRADHRLRQSGQPRFRCGICTDPVHIRVTSVVESGTTGGRRAYFVHDPRTTPRDCPFGAGSEHTSPGMIDGMRFRGRQEGARHRHLKVLLRDMLLADPKVMTADCEVLVTGVAPDSHSTWRRPDVLAITTDGRRLAFDVQLASPLIATIDARERFYAAQNIAWHWIVDADRPDRLQLQGFQDLVLPQGGRVLGIDAEIAANAIRAGCSQLQLLRVIETADLRGFRVRSRAISLERVLAFAGFPEGGPRSFAPDWRAVSLFTALNDGEMTLAGRIFDLISANCGVPGWDVAQRDGLPQVIKALIALWVCRDADAMDIALMRYLGHDQDAESNPRDWLFLIIRLARADTRIRNRLLHCRRDLRAALGAAIRKTADNPGPSDRLWSRWHPLLGRLFPRLAA